MSGLWELPWPFPIPVVQALLWDPRKDPPGRPPSAGPAQRVANLVGRPARSMGYLAIGLLARHLALPDAAAAARPFAEWVLPLVAFNFASVLLLYGFWHWFLYCGPDGGPVLPKLRWRKFNQDVKGYAVRHDFVYSMQGVAVSSAIECHLWRALGSGAFALQPGAFADNPLLSAGLVLLIPYWMELHFFCIHRILHPWGWKLPLVGDPGRFIYRHVHSLHHKSFSPGPWSGMSMHPLEHLVFFSSYVIALVVPLHPVHIFFITNYSRLSPLAGHDGYDRPGGASLVHYLHHAKFEVNYGTPVVPMDKWFGSLDDGTSYRLKTGLKAL
eukprot:TRINITY_DN14903_c0_g1_i1.p1 TRINITY_DN14903_c0_g1~~TRINITY_DN14903_c0_g1_i1.p1  ORF type:complete len:327 (+),score=98.96 TRINITY_DN14903_c0_g1_i1:80-1060(+)